MTGGLEQAQGLLRVADRLPRAVLLLLEVAEAHVDAGLAEVVACLPVQAEAPHQMSFGLVPLTQPGVSVSQAAAGGRLARDVPQTCRGRHRVL